MKLFIILLSKGIVKLSTTNKGEKREGAQQEAYLLREDAQGQVGNPVAAIK